jgi:hypothetical protein
MALNPLTQKLTAFFGNIRIDIFTGIMEYIFSKKTKRAYFRITASKGLVDEQEAVTDPTGRDNFIVRAGTLEEDEHIIEVKVNQDIKSAKATPIHSSLTRIGKQKDGTYFQHSSQTGESQEQQVYLAAKNDSTVKASFKNREKHIDLLLNVNEEPAATLSVNGDKAIVTIKHTGDVEIKTTDGAFIKLGGQGKEQQLVTKSFVEQVFVQHIHGSSNGPTTPPISPVAIDLGVDSSTGHYTFTTKAE